MTVISVKYTSIIAIAAFAAGSFFAPPVQQAIAAVIATDVQCTGCVGTADLAGNAVTSPKIKDGEVKTEDIAVSAIGSARIKDNDVKAQDLAPDSVGASEVQGVSKLIFGTCTFNGQSSIPEGSLAGNACFISGVAPGDKVSVTKENGNACFAIVNSIAQTGSVLINYGNVCTTTQNAGTMTFSVIAYVPG